MLTTYSYSAGCCLSSTTSKSGELAALMIEDGEDSDPLIMCFSSTSVLVGRGGKASPMYAICCKTSIITDLLRPAMHQHKSTTPSSSNNHTTSTPIVDLDVSSQDNNHSSIITSLIPREIVSLARGEALVVTYPLAWSHIHDGDELELLSSFIFSTLGAATSLFVAAPLAAAYGLGIGLKEGDESVAKGLIQQHTSPTTTNTTTNSTSAAVEASINSPNGPPPPKSQMTGSKRPRDAEEVVVDVSSSGSTCSSSSSSSSGNGSEDSDESSSEDEDDDDDSTTKRSRKTVTKNKKTSKSKSKSSKRRAFGGRLLSVQIDASSMTVSHIALGSIQRFIKVSLGVKERGAFSIDASPILTSLEGALSTINTFVASTANTTSSPLCSSLVVLQRSLHTLRQCIIDVSRYNSSNGALTPSLTELLVASRDLALTEVTTTTTLSVQLEDAVKNITKLCALRVSGEYEEEERVKDVHTACNKLCASARASFHSLLLRQSEEDRGSSVVIADLFSKTGAVGNAIGKLEAKLDIDEEGDRHRPTSLISLGGEVMEWLRIEASRASPLSSSVPTAAMSTLQAIEESACRSITSSSTARRMLLLPTTANTHQYKNNTHPNTMIEFQGASLVAAIGDKDFLKLSMTAAEYSEKGPSHIRWRCAR